MKVFNIKQYTDAARDIGFVCISSSRNGRKGSVLYLINISRHLTLLVSFIFQIKTRIVKLKCDCVSFRLVSRAENSAPTDGFLLNSLKTVFSLSRVFLKGLWKCILSSAIKFVPVRSF